MESPQQHDAPRDGPDEHRHLRDRPFEFTFDCSVPRVGAGGGGNGSIIEPDSISSTMSASSIDGGSTSSGINSSFSRYDDSASLSDSVQTFPEQFGRTYHAYRAGSYAFPNDTPEQERLELQGECIKMLLGDRLYFAPLDSSPPRAILDVATGVGDWAIQMGDEFPNSVVYGTDLSPIQPAEVPPNVHFYVEDATDPWDFNQQFDYIHTRFTSGCWSSFETQIAEQAFATLEPGGWLESQEIDCNFYCDDNTLPLDGAAAKWSNDLIVASEKLGRPAIFGLNLKEIFERVGFVDVQQRIYKMPVGGWAKDYRLKEIGYMWGTNVLEGMAGFSLQLFNKAFDRTAAEIEVDLIDVRRELTNHRIHAYYPAFVVWGRKPRPDEK